MKTLKEIKSGKSRWMLALAVAVAASGFVFALDPPETSYSKSEFKKENTDIRQDMRGITTSQSKIESLQAKLDKDKANRDKVSCIAHHKELKKAKADLKRDKAYLRADKKDLKMDHAYSIGQTRAEVRKEKRELQASKCELKKDLRKGNSFSLRSDIDEIERNQKELNADQALLDRKLDTRDAELTAVNTELVDAGIRNELVVFNKKYSNRTETAQAAKSEKKQQDAKATASAEQRGSGAEWMK